MAQQEEIIEKRAGSPIMTSCLMLAALALIGAIAFQIAEISEVRAKIRPQSLLTSENPAQAIRKKDAKDEDDLINQMQANFQGDENKPFHKEAEEKLEKDHSDDESAGKAEKPAGASKGAAKAETQEETKDGSAKEESTDAGKEKDAGAEADKEKPAEKDDAAAEKTEEKPSEEKAEEK